MATKADPQKSSKIIQVYLDKYADKKRFPRETIYTMTPEEVEQISDFLNPKKAKVFLCFYNFSGQDYDKMSREDIQFFATGNIQLPQDKITVTDQGFECGVNICVPAREGVIDKALVNELLSHELRHAYRMYNEYTDGHISNPNPYKREKLDKEKEPYVKYTFSMRQERYNNLLLNIKNDGSIQDCFSWIGYTLVSDEINATLAGIDAFLFEHNGDSTKLSESRGVMLIDIVKDYLKKISEKTTDADWEWCRKNALYIHNRKDESVGRFKKRYMDYYAKQLRYFESGLQKIIDKYKMRAAQNKVFAKLQKQNQIAKKVVKDMCEM